jgi:hypothetical protein
MVTAHFAVLPSAGVFRCKSRIGELSAKIQNLTEPSLRVQAGLEILSLVNRQLAGSSDEIARS